MIVVHLMTEIRPHTGRRTHKYGYDEGNDMRGRFREDTACTYTHTHTRTPSLITL